MRVEIALEKEQAEALLNSTSENLRTLAEEYFAAEEYSKEHEEGGFNENGEYIYSIHIEEVEVNREDFKVLKKLGVA